MESVKLDDVDKGIIGALQADGRRPYSRIAADLGVSESVVRYRAQRLEQAGVLQVVGIADPLRIGFDRMALIGLKVRPGSAGRRLRGGHRVPGDVLRRRDRGVLRRASSRSSAATPRTSPSC